MLKRLVTTPKYEGWISTARWNPVIEIDPVSTKAKPESPGGIVGFRFLDRACHFLAGNGQCNTWIS